MADVCKLFLVSFDLLGRFVGYNYVVNRLHNCLLLLREDLRRIGEKLAEGLALSVRNPYRTSLWLALLTASYFPAGEETLVPKR